MIKNNLTDVKFITANTDVQALKNTLAQNKIALGTNNEILQGIGAGGDVKKVVVTETTVAILTVRIGSQKPRRTACRW